MMRAILILLFFAAPVFAQESGIIIATSDEVGYLVSTHQFVWLDADTLIFEPFRDPGSVQAYEYRVSTGKVTRHDLSPLYFEPTPERVEHYQMALSEPGFSRFSFRSPFTSSSSLEHLLHPIIYLSRLSVSCGFECPGGIIMAGTHDDQPDYTQDELYESGVDVLSYISARAYRPLSTRTYDGLSVHWSRDASAAVLQIAYPYGAGSHLHYANLEHHQFGIYGAEIYLGDVFPEFGTHLYALSGDGSRGIYGIYTPEEASKESLRVWQVVPADADEPWAAQRLPSVTVAAESSAEDAFAGANFISGDEAHILALHSDGIVRIDLATGERSVLNDALTAQDYPLGVFAPDNQHIAVVTAAGDVQVLPTGIE